MADVLIDLGPHWGHVVPLKVLERISHITIASNGQITVKCGDLLAEEAPIFEFKSNTGLSEDDQVAEKSRMLGFSNGVVDRDDMRQIYKSLEDQTGEEIKYLLEKPHYDISEVRKIWATLNDQPHFRFVLNFNANDGEIMIEEDHNDAFMGVLPEWISEEQLRDMESDEERVLYFAYEVIYRMAEPLIPEPEAGAMIDPTASIPSIGDKPVNTKVDLKNIYQNQLINPRG